MEVAKSQKDEAISQIVQNYFDSLREQSIKLFSGRVDALSRFYGTVFDEKPTCLRIISVPADQPAVTPSVFAIYREARFVLDSDQSEKEALNEFWKRLHPLVDHELDPVALANMAMLNFVARWRITQCKEEVMNSMPEFFRLLERDSAGAQELADKTLANISQTFDGILSTYLTPALQPR